MAEKVQFDVQAPIKSVSVINDSRIVRLIESKQSIDVDAISREQQRLAGVCEALEKAAARLSTVCEDIIASHREQLARLSVEIAEKILLQCIQSNNYDIIAIIKEALAIAPSKKEVVVKVSQADYEKIIQKNQDKDESVFKNVALEADPNIGQAQCVVQTDKGIIEYFIEEHLRQIEEALKGNA